MFYEVRMRAHDLEIEIEAEKRGKERASALYAKLIDEGRLDDARKAMVDEEYRNQLLKEHNMD